MVKYVIFFLVLVGVGLYCVTFFENKKKVKVRVLGKEREITLGLLLLTAFLDGAVLSFVLYWLIWG